MRLTIHEITVAILMAADRIIEKEQITRQAMTVTIFNTLCKLACLREHACDSVSDLADSVEKGYYAGPPWDG